MIKHNLSSDNGRGVATADATSIAFRTPAESGYADVNGLKLYYEVYGAGRPLVLLHGGFAVISMFGPLLPALAETRQVIAVEMQAHGHTADIDRPLTFEQMADDTAALITHLGLKTADVLGYSLGGGVALQTAIRHPDIVRKLVVVSAPYKRDGWYPEVLIGMEALNAEMMTGTVLYQAYTSVAPHPKDWSKLTDKTRQLLGQAYNWAQDVAAIKAPTLIVVGDADSVSPAHAVEMFGLLGGGQADGTIREAPPVHLAVLPGTTHYTILNRLDLLLPIMRTFLDPSE